MHILWNIKQLAETIQTSIENKFDFIVVIDGRRGLGKSTLGIKTALRFPAFKMAKHILFKSEEIMDALGKLMNHTLVLDEMINVTHNRDFFAEDQKKLIKMLNMYRDSGNIILCCVPNFAHLDNQFRDLTKMRIHIERRGLGVIHTPNQSAYAKDKWDMAINEKIEARWMRRGIYKPNYKKLTTYRGMIHFNKLTDNQQEAYDKIKFVKRNQVMMANEPEKENPYERIYNLIRQGLIEKDKMRVTAMTMGITHSQLRHGIMSRAEKDGLMYKNLWESNENKKILINLETNNDRINQPITLNGTNGS